MSDGISSQILFITGLVVASLIAVFIIQAGYAWAGVLENTSDDLEHEYNSDILIISGPENIYDSASGELTVYVVNSGSNTLNEDSLVVLLNGERLDAEFTHSSGNGEWNEGDVLEITVDEPLAEGEYLLELSFSHSSDSIEFYTGGSL